MPPPDRAHAAAGLARAIPALPVRDVPAAVAFYGERLGFAAPRGVLHPTARDGVSSTDFGTREFPTLDLDGNLVTFFRWESG